MVSHCNIKVSILRFLIRGVPPIYMYVYIHVPAFVELTHPCHTARASLNRQSSVEHMLSTHLTLHVRVVTVSSKVTIILAVSCIHAW